MKTAFLYTKWATHFNFTTLKSLKSFQAMKKGETDIALEFTSSTSETLEQGEVFINTVFINPA